MNVCGLFLFVCLSCECVRVCVLSTSDGKRPGSSSSFGTRGNMTQMGAISPNRQGPAAQEATTHTENDLKCRHRDVQCDFGMSEFLRSFALFYSLPLFQSR